MTSVTAPCTGTCRNRCSETASPSGRGGSDGPRCRYWRPCPRLWGGCTCHGSICRCSASCWPVRLSARCLISLSRSALVLGALRSSNGPLSPRSSCSLRSNGSSPAALIRAGQPRTQDRPDALRWPDLTSEKRRRAPFLNLLKSFYILLGPPQPLETLGSEDVTGDKKGANRGQKGSEPGTCRCSTDSVCPVMEVSLCCPLVLDLR